MNVWQWIWRSFIGAWFVWGAIDLINAGCTAAREVWLAGVSKSWPKAEAEIIDGRKRWFLFPYLRTNAFKITVRYRYFGGIGKMTRYTANEYMADGNFGNYAPGDKASIRVNPSNQAQSYLASDIGYAGSLVLGSIGIVFSIVLVAVVRDLLHG